MFCSIFCIHAVPKIAIPMLFPPFLRPILLALSHEPDFFVPYSLLLSSPTPPIATKIFAFSLPTHSAMILLFDSFFLIASPRLEIKLIDTFLFEWCC